MALSSATEKPGDALGPMNGWEVSVLGRLYVLAVVSATMAVGVALDIATTVIVVGGLIVFGVVFALNSSLHSFLILDYARGDKVAMNVGFYYMANAAGRLGGTIFSGLIYQWQGLEACLWASTAFILAAGALSLMLPTRPQRTVGAAPIGA